MKISGVIHMHSTFSYDGKIPLSELKNFLIQRDVSFCCMTEHTDKLTHAEAQEFVKKCTELSDEKFVFVPGFEVPYKNTHLLHVGAKDFISQIADSESLKKWREISPLVILAHPVRNHFQLDQSLEKNIDGIEIWNQQYEGKQAPRFRSLRLYWKLKKQRSGLLAVGGLDLHREEHLGTPKLELELEELSAEAVVKALQAGDFVSISKTVAIDARGRFLKGGGIATRWQSFVSVFFITSGKFVNRVLALLGLSFPKSWRQIIRRQV